MCVCKGVQVFWCMFVSVLVGGGVLFWFYLNVISCFSHHHQPTLPLFVIRCCFTLFCLFFSYSSSTYPPKLKSKQKHSLSVSPISLSSSQLHIHMCINQHTYTKKTGEFIKTRKCFAFYFEPLFFFFARRQNKQIKENFRYKNIFFLQVYLVHVCMQVRLCERLNWFKFIHFVSSKCSYLNISLDFALWQSSFFVVPYGGNMRAPLRARGST